MSIRNIYKISFFLFIIIILFDHSLCDTNSDEDLGFEFSFGDYIHIGGNITESKCFRILKIPPWSKKREIQAKYKKLQKLYSSSNKQKEKEELEKAYKFLKDKFKDGSLKERTFYEVVLLGFKDLIILEAIFGGAYLLSKLIYMFQEYFSKFILFQIISFLVISRFFPHYFDDELIQYLISFVLGLVLFFRRKIFGLCFEIRDVTDEKENKD
ncbi:MAG: hypothetical protein MJ252_21395, partial [archaeon]|nr:hypothetical protein [archaeon]